MNLHPAEVPLSENDDCSNYAYQFDEASLFTQLQSFSYSAAACSGQMYFEHLLHAVTSAIPNQSKNLIKPYKISEFGQQRTTAPFI